MIQQILSPKTPIDRTEVIEEQLEDHQSALLKMIDENAYLMTQLKSNMHSISMLQSSVSALINLTQRLVDVLPEGTSVDNKPILDPCCGSRMFYHNKSNPLVDYCDIREETLEMKDKDKIRTVSISPDYIMDFREIKFPTESKNLIIFDPPHLIKAGKNSWLVKKYGKLQSSWKFDLQSGFRECFRVLRTGGTLVFKWNETDIPLSEILKLSEYDPLISQKIKGDTHWVIYYKHPTLLKAEEDNQENKKK